MSADQESVAPWRSERLPRPVRQGANQGRGLG